MQDHHLCKKCIIVELDFLLLHHHLKAYQPFLIKEGFLKRTPRGREVTDFAYQHLGRSRLTGGYENSLF